MVDKGGGGGKNKEQLGQYLKGWGRLLPMRLILVMG